MLVPRRYHLLATAGAGIRYRTPIGPLRIDVAFKMNNFLASRLEQTGTQLEKEAKSWGRVHFGIGHAF